MPWRESQDGQRFINPYNFVRLGNDISRAPGKEPPKGDLTGVIHCVLETMTPLAVPDTELKHDIPLRGGKVHSEYPFFRVDGDPAIPGSEIRGMVRSTYEAATDSCMSVINTNILSARHPFPRKPGLIRYMNGHWELFEAEKYMLNTEGPGSVSHGGYYPIVKAGDKWHINFGGRDYKTGDIISFTPGPQYVTSGGVMLTAKVVDMAGAGALNGYLLLWEDIGNKTKPHHKHHNSIFREITNAQGGLIPVLCVNIDDAVKDFNYLEKIYEERNETKSYDKVSYALKKDGSFMPVWYETVQDDKKNTYVYLSPACISRTVFKNRLEDLIGAHKKCHNTKDGYNLCPACQLFGMIGEKGEKSLGSSLRFSDAVMIGQTEGCSMGKKRLKILSGPKTSSVEFYTRRPDGALTWSYDFETTDYIKATRGDMPVPVRHMTRVEPNGRKFYLHNMAVNSNPGLYTSDSPLSDQNATMELVKPGKQFSFDVYFENITSDQLNELIWVLTLGENPSRGSAGQSILCHKIGHGKPLGLGSVKIIVESAEERKIAVKDGKLVYNCKPYTDYKNSVSSSPRTADEFKQLLKFCGNMKEMPETGMNLARTFFGRFAKIKEAEPPAAKPQKKPAQIVKGGKMKGLNSLANISFEADKSSAKPAPETRYNVSAPAYLLDLLRIANIHTCDGGNVCYPLANAGGHNQNSEASHQWFAGNRQMGTPPQNNGRAITINVGGIVLSIKRTLPLAGETSVSGAGSNMEAPGLALEKLERV